MIIRDFIDQHFRHFNAASLRDAARGYEDCLDRGGRMLVTLAGAMSTAELGRSLAEMIRRGKVHAISCTGANLEEDLFHLVAASRYRRVPNYRDLTPDEEQALLDEGLARVTDTCIPEEAAIRVLERHLVPIWQRAAAAGERRLPHEYVYELVRSGSLERDPEADPATSWVMAAAERDLPLFVPGWEDSTLGNIFTARVLDGTLPSTDAVLPGLEYMRSLAAWYREGTGGGGGQNGEEAARRGVGPGFFQIGGGIAGDFPICVVPMLRYDLKEDAPVWSYFCQISDSTTSFGSYSGAEPNEKITWGKLGRDTPRFMIESDATIVAPLVFAYVLGW